MPCNYRISALAFLSAYNKILLNYKLYLANLAAVSPPVLIAIADAVIQTALRIAIPAAANMGAVIILWPSQQIGAASIASMAIVKIVAMVIIASAVPMMTPGRTFVLAESFYMWAFAAFSRPARLTGGGIGVRASASGQDQSKTGGDCYCL
jgi:hypothetical protein